MCVSLLPLRQKKFNPRHIHGFFFFLHTLGTVLEQACYHKTMIANKHTLSVELKLYHRTHRLGTSRAEMIHVAGDKTDESNCAIQL